MQYNFLNQLMQMYGIGKMEPTVNPLMQYQQQFQQQTQQPQQKFNPQQPFVAQQPQANTNVPQQNTLAPQGHFNSVSPNFQIPQQQPKMGIPGGMYGPSGTTGNNSVTGGFDINYLTPNRG